MGTELNDAYLKKIKEIAESAGSAVMPVEDLVQEGCIGFLTAAGHYDEKKDGDFWNYAEKWVRQSIGLALTSRSAEEKAPLRLAYMMNQVSECRQELAGRKKKIPTAEELAVELRYPLERVCEILTLSDHTEAVSFKKEQPDKGDDSFALSSVMELREQLREILDDLDPVERELITLRFGLGGRRPMEIDAAAEELGLSGEAADSMEKKALGRLASADNRLKLKNYLD